MFTNLKTLQKQQIESEIDARVTKHQHDILTTRKMLAGQSGLNLLAIGDSWFDYPLSGGIPFVHTDVISQLSSVDKTTPTILNLAHYGYSSVQEMGLTQQQRLQNVLTNPANGEFDAILLSAGGNDIMGDPLCIWLNDAAEVGNDFMQAVNKPRLANALGMVQAVYLDIIAIRDVFAPHAPIFVHSYDYPYPTGVGVFNAIGPWLKPSLNFCGWNDPAEGHTIISMILDQFSDMLTLMCSAPENNMVQVPTRGSLLAAQWANELHPTPDGFRKIAGKFQIALDIEFEDRI